ncbi:MAG: hypothetical protein LKG11_06710 [Bacilli bacterium]|jgi:hypothetical protein|nr:hypothetical protein [Bacilli bacterium]
MNRKFQARLAYSWPLYLILPLVLGFTVSYLFYVSHRPAYFETVDVFVGAGGVEKDDFAKKIETELSDDGMKEATVTYCDPSDSLYSQKLSVVGYNGSDLFLLPKSTLESIACSDIMLPFEDAEGFVGSYCGGASGFFEQDGKSYGVGIDASGWLSDYVSFVDEDYYLCVNSISKNIGDMGLYDNPEYDLALKEFVYLRGGAA